MPDPRRKIHGSTYQPRLVQALLLEEKSHTPDLSQLHSRLRYSYNRALAKVQSRLTVANETPKACAVSS